MVPQKKQAVAKKGTTAERGTGKVCLFEVGLGDIQLPPEIDNRVEPGQPFALTLAKSSDLLRAII